MNINFVTTNTLKFEIAGTYFSKTDGTHQLVQYKIDTPEIQDNSVVEIARQSALWAAKETGEICIKVDVGFFIAALNGFPGPFVKYVNDWLTQEDILKMIDSKDDRAAYFEDAMAIGFPDGTSEVFSSKVHGSLSLVADTSSTRWPMNLLFIPDGHDQTLGSMSDNEQNKFWGDGNWPALVGYMEQIS